MGKARTLYFAAPKQIEIREQPLPALEDDQVLVETACSAISAGTEMLVYRGQFPRVSDAHDSLSSNLKYPLPYGYASVGKVRQVGSMAAEAWMDRTVFSFQPHTSHFVTTLASLIPVPDGLSAEAASFLPGMETAVNLVQDGAPILGERVLVLGQGIVGLLTASLLKEFPLETVVVADNYELRRNALRVEAQVSNVDEFQASPSSLDPSRTDFLAQANSILPNGADLAYELSGSPAALDQAIALTVFSGRVVIGSWYGEKRAEIDLGGGFHRSRIKLISSQVSTISPELSARWDKSRRFKVAWEALARIRPEKWITHRFPIEDAARAYQLLDVNPQETIQVILNYG